MPDLPKGPIVVVGAGYISLEFSGIYNGMGKDVHLFYRKPLPLVGYVSFLLCTKVQPAVSQTGNTAVCIGSHVGLHFLADALPQIMAACVAFKWRVATINCKHVTESGMWDDDYDYHVASPAVGPCRPLCCSPASQWQHKPALNVICLLHRFDEECRAQVAENMQKRGVHIYSETQPIR